MENTSTPVSTPQTSAPQQTPTAPSKAPSSSPQSGAPQGSSPNGELSKSQPQKDPTPAAAPEMWEVKVNGKVQKMTRQEALDLASMSHAANSKFDEAAKMRKEYESKQKTYAENPIQAFLDYAATLPPDQRRKALEDYYMREYIEPESLTEEQKRLKSAEERLKKYEDQEKQSKQKQEQDQFAELTHKQKEFLTGQILEAFQKSNLPEKNAFLVGRMAFYMRQAAQRGWEAPQELIIKQVKAEHQDLVRGFAKDASVEQLVEAFGEETINKIRKYDLEKLRSSRRSLAPSFSNENQHSSPMPDKIYSSDVQKRLKEMRTGKKLY